MKSDQDIAHWLRKVHLEEILTRLLAPVNRALAPVDRMLAGAEAKVAPFWKQVLYVWALVTCAVLALRFVALRADFPLDKIGKRFVRDGFLYTDEGWYTAGAVRWFRTGDWYMDGDLNLAVVMPVLNVMHAAMYSVFGVGIESARSVAVLCFIALCALTYLLVRRFEAPWVGIAAVWVMATNYFFFTHSRLAIGENPAMMFIVASALLATYAGGRRVWWMSAIVGFVFLLGVLTKTPSIVFAPVIAMGLFIRNWPGGWRLKPAMVGSAAIFSVIVLGGYLGWNALMRVWYPLDVEYFRVINTGHRTEMNPYRWFEHANWFLKQLPRIDRVVFNYVLFVVPCLFLLNRRFRRSPLAIGAAVALFIYFVTFSVYGNRQFRYYAAVSPLLGIIVAVGVSALWDSRRGGALQRLAFVAGGALLVSVAARGGSSLVRMYSNLEYTYSDGAARVAALYEEHDLPNRALLGHIACTFALYEDFIPVNDLYETGPLAERLARWRPHVMVAEYPVEPSAQQIILEQVDGDPRDSVARLRILREYGRIEHLGPMDILKNVDDRDLQLYRLHPNSDESDTP